MTFMLPYNSILPQETIPADQGPESVPGAGEGRGPLSAGAATDFVKESFDMSAGFLKGMANAWLGIGGDVERLTTGLMYAANPNEGEGPIDAFLRRGLAKTAHCSTTPKTQRNSWTNICLMSRQQRPARRKSWIVREAKLLASS